MKTAKPKVTVGYLGLLRVALLLVLAGGMGTTGCEPIDVQCGDTLDIDHGQYRLNEDLVCPFRFGQSAAVRITGEGVDFDLNGHTIRPGFFAGRALRWGVHANGAHARIHDGSIVNMNCPFFGDFGCGAILLNDDAHSAWIYGMSLHNNTNGIIVIDRASGAHIHGNDVTGNLHVGIELMDEADGAWVTRNDVSDTGGFTLPDGTPDGGKGLKVFTDDSYFIGNVANNCDLNGISLLGGYSSPTVPLQGFAERNKVLYNTALDNGRAGLIAVGMTEADRPRDNLIQGNISISSVWDGRDVGEGIFAVGGASADCLNTWKDNDFEVAKPADCIE